MREQGLVQYTEKVTKYWPEFGQNGKDKLTVANVMKHEAGLNRLKTMIGPEDLTTEAIKQNKAGKILEDDYCLYFCGCKRAYHTETRDIIAGEIFRRVEPQKRTMHEYMREEVAPKFGGLDYFIALPESEFHRTYTK